MPIRRWLDSGDVYTVRYGMEMLMRYYLDDAFRPEYLEWVADVRSTEYYINMMRAWYFATALAKQPDAALPWLHRATPPCLLDAQQDHPESRGKLPHPGRKEAAAAGPAQPFIKASGFPRRFPVYFMNVLL